MKLNIDDEQGIDILHLIFERELKPPFSKGDKDIYDRDTYHNRDGEYFGRLDSQRKKFVVRYDPFWYNIMHKVCQVFELNRFDWWDATKPHLKSWMENELNIKLRYIE